MYDENRRLKPHQEYTLDFMCSAKHRSKYLKTIKGEEIHEYEYEEEEEDGEERIKKSGVLSLEMGLGKTRTMIKYAIKMKLYPALVVVPPTLKEQWKRELKLMCNGRVCVYNSKNEDYKDYDFVIISNYKISDVKTRSHVFARYKLYIIDEIHQYKNKRTERYKNMRQIVNTNEEGIVWGLTGTPIVNKYKDIENIAILTKSELDEDYIKHNFLYMKNDLIEVRKIIHNIYVEMDDEHYREYCETMMKTKKMLENQIYRDKIPNVLASIIRLRQASVHQDLALPSTNEIEITKDNSFTMSIINEVARILDKYEEDKIIIFVEWKRLSRYLKRRLKNYNIKSVIYSGETSILEFKEEETKVMILNIKSGSVGLNLQNANHCIFTSHNWNDANIQQAIGRVNRIGQNKDIHIYNMYPNNTIGVWIDTLIKEKIKVTRSFIEKEERTRINKEITTEQLHNYLKGQLYKNTSTEIHHPYTTTKKYNKRDLLNGKIYDEVDDCVICIANEVENVIVPCGHMILCDDKMCKDKDNYVNGCPECRHPITDIVKREEIEEEEQERREEDKVDKCQICNGWIYEDDETYIHKCCMNVMHLRCYIRNKNNKIECVECKEIMCDNKKILEEIIKKKEEEDEEEQHLLENNNQHIQQNQHNQHIIEDIEEDEDD